MSCKEKDNRCVCETLEFIADLQDAVEDDDFCAHNCNNPVLGEVFNNQPRANTRPFVLYTKEGKLFKALFKPVMIPTDADAEDFEHGGHHGHKKGCNDFDDCLSPFFRVESVKDCCAVLRVLMPVGRGDDACDVVEGDQRLIATNSCITVDLDCFCAVQCLRDIFLRGV
ncbi:spore coat protein Z [Bacillus sp. HMF5848]|uniref:CotY/CotZ family spore coat protein n=1 Tax=Bacillus sp. HMF5848 TaxID=2495421 RepID=UPI000F7A626C|nr:CotY/CotZ family spore coat protein [Bacillus sp. HMF5848]RSK26510.1 spore coat protein Z [Bacillus sp. HMF5848]